MNDSPAMPATACPYCDYRLDAATEVGGDATPSPGDVTICLSCAQVLLFDDDTRPRRPEPGELKAIFDRCPITEAGVLRAQRSVRSLDRRNLGDRTASTMETV